MWDYLKINSLNFEVPFSKTELTRWLNENGISLIKDTEMNIVIKSKVLSLDIVFNIIFQFRDEKLISIMMSPDKFLEGEDLYLRYDEIQMVLVKELGIGNTFNPLQVIINVLVPDSRSFCWKKKGAKIEHYLLNRFGMEEIISINFNS